MVYCWPFFFVLFRSFTSVILLHVQLLIHSSVWYLLCFRCWTAKTPCGCLRPINEVTGILLFPCWQFSHFLSGVSDRFRSSVSRLLVQTWKVNPVSFSTLSVGFLNLLSAQFSFLVCQFEPLTSFTTLTGFCLCSTGSCSVLIRLAISLESSKPQG